MAQGGTEEAGYAIDLDVPTGTLRARIWGLWSVALTAECVHALKKAGDTTPRPHTLILDAIRFKPQRAEVQDAWRHAISELSAAGMTRGAIAVPSSITRLQLARLITESKATGWTCHDSVADIMTALKLTR